MLRAISFAGSPSTETDTANPSASLIPTATTPGACAIPSAHPVATPSRKGSEPPPSQAWASHRPVSSPVSSCQKITSAPSAVAKPLSTPTGWSETWRVPPDATSSVWTCQIPLSFVS